MRIGAGQTLIDAALQTTGKAENAWAMAEANGVSITDLVEQSERKEEMEGKRRKRVVRSYGGSGTEPATELTEGIGGWRVGQGYVR